MFNSSFPLFSILSIFRDCHCAVNVQSRTVSYDLSEAISRREGRETSLVCILDPLSLATRSKKKTSGTLWRGGVRRLSVSRKNYSHVLRSLSLCLYLPASRPFLTYYTLFTIRRRKQETGCAAMLHVAVILNRRRRSRRSFTISLCQSIHLRSSKPPSDIVNKYWSRKCR